MSIYPATHRPRLSTGGDPRLGASRQLGGGFALLAGLILLYVALGPLVLDVIHFRTSASGLNQIRGGDLAALLVVTPTCLVVAWLAHHGHRAAPTLGLAPAIFAMYTYSQLILANEFLHRPGNVERYFPLLLGIFLVATGLALRCWALVRSDQLPSTSRRLERRSAILLLVMAGFVVVGIHLPMLVDVYSGRPAGSAYLETPNTFWVVKFYDLGIVVPAALVVGVGLLRRRVWARKPAYAILGGYVLLGWSVAGMAWTMLVQDDPDALLVQAVGMTGLAAAGAVFSFYLYRPLFSQLDCSSRAATTRPADQPGARPPAGGASALTS